MRTAVMGNKTIAYGDRIFARVMQNGKTIYNFVSETVGSMTEVIAELRKVMKGVKGLVMIQIRNYNRGWNQERPLMLYSRETSSNAGRMLFPWETH